MSTEEQAVAVEETPATTTGVTAGVADATPKMKEAKLASERKRSRGLGEDKSFKLFSGTANRPLAEEIAGFIGVKLGESKLQRFADGEVYFQLLETCAAWMCLWCNPPAIRWTSTWWSFW